MGFLPELGQYCRNTFFDPPVAPELLEKVASDPEIRYIFTRFSSMTPEALEWIEHSGCEIVLEKDDWPPHPAPRPESSLPTPGISPANNQGLGLGEAPPSPFLIIPANSMPLPLPNGSFS